MRIRLSYEEGFYIRILRGRTWHRYSGPFPSKNRALVASCDLDLGEDEYFAISELNREDEKQGVIVSTNYYRKPEKRFTYSHLYDYLVREGIEEPNYRKRPYKFRMS